MDVDLAVLGACCRAFAATPRRLVRPRRPNRRLLARLADAERTPPPASRRVALTPLVQARQTAPTAVVAEGAFRPRRLALSMTSFLVEHPRARFLVDPAMCADAHTTVVPDIPAPFRQVVTPDKPVLGLAEALDDRGVSPERIDFALATHLHWDHVCGVTELNGDLIVRTPDVERAFALEGDRPPLGVVRGPLRDRRFEPCELDGPPVLTFTRSHDLFGDGSVVLLDLAGHTPGSVGVLLAVAEDRRVLLAGDAVWHGMQIRLLREKAPFPGALVDADRDAAFETVHRLHALPPQVEVIASHDHAAAVAFARGTRR